MTLIYFIVAYCVSVALMILWLHHSKEEDSIQAHVNVKEAKRILKHKIKINDY